MYNLSPTVISTSFDVAYPGATPINKLKAKYGTDFVSTGSPIKQTAVRYYSTGETTTNFEFQLDTGEIITTDPGHPIMIIMDEVITKLFMIYFIVDGAEDYKTYVIKKIKEKEKEKAGMAGSSGSPAPGAAAPAPYVWPAQGGYRRKARRTHKHKQKKYKSRKNTRRNRH